MSHAQLILSQLGAITVLPWLMWHGFAVRRIVPRVLVQIICGIALGPAVLGRFLPQVQLQLFGSAQDQFLDGVAAIGLLFFGFLTGLHLDLRVWTQGKCSVVAVAAGSFLIPWLLGAAVATWLLGHGWHDPGGLGHSGLFVAGIASCLAVTALPVLVEILREMGELRTPFGQRALALAAVNDLAIWAVLSLVLAAAQSSRTWLHPVLAITLLSAVVLLVSTPGRSCWRNLLAWALRHESLCSEAVLITVIAATLTLALLTETLGFHPLIGAFLAGAIFPREYAAPILQRLEPLTVTVLLPFFFVTTGLHTSLVLHAPDLLRIALACGLATTAGKLLGTALPARAIGLSWRESCALGVAMQTKGLMEVVVLTVLRDARVIGSETFAALVLMALTTTLLTKPVLQLLGVGRAVPDVGTIEIGPIGALE